MSAGTKVYTIRLSELLVKWLDETRQRRNAHSREAAWDLSEQIRTMLAREMRKMARSRTRGPSRLAPRRSAAVADAARTEEGK